MSTDLDMAKVREARKRYVRNRYGMVSRSDPTVAGQELDDTRALADYACHILASGAVVVPAEDFALAVKELRDWATSAATRGMASRSDRVHYLIDRLAKPGEA